MSFFISAESFQYYEGDKMHAQDLQVSRRPSPSHAWQNGEWVSTLSLDEIKKAKFEEIKTERDRRRFNGGVKVGELWFLTTQVAISEYNSLALLSATLPTTTVLRTAWRTMSGATIDMTPVLVHQILQAGFAQAAAIDDAATVHKTAMEASEDPANYDFSEGWPEIFEDQA